MMDKILVILFNDESRADEGAMTLEELHSESSFHLYTKVVIARDAGGKVDVKQKGQTGPIGAAVNVFTENLIGRFGSSEGLGGDVDAGAFGSILIDLACLGVDEDFLSEVESSFEPGKAAVIAHVWEERTLAVDQCMEKLGGEVYRSIRS